LTQGKEEENKVEDEAILICFRIPAAVEVIEFTTTPRENAALAAEEALKIAEMEESFVRCNKAQVNLVSAMPDGTPIQVLEKNIHLVHAHCQALILFFSNT
jgi:hypothetical protein